MGVWECEREESAIRVHCWGGEPLVYSNMRTVSHGRAALVEGRADALQAHVQM